jgi:hypothetical protein
MHHSTSPCAGALLAFQQTCSAPTICYHATSIHKPAMDTAPSKVDRQTTTPFHLKLFYKNGGFHRYNLSLVYPSSVPFRILTLQAGQTSSAHPPTFQATSKSIPGKHVPYANSPTFLHPHYLPCSLILRSAHDSHSASYFRTPGALQVQGQVDT